MDKQSTASEFQGMLEARGVSRRSFMKLVWHARGYGWLG